MHIQNKNMPLRYNLNPATKQTTGRTAPITRVDLLGIADQLGLSPFSSDVWIVEYIGETKYDGLNLAVEKRFADFWGARLSYALGKGTGQHQRHADGDQLLPGARRAQPGSERGSDQCRPPSRGDAQRTRSRCRGSRG